MKAKRLLLVIIGAVALLLFSLPGSGAQGDDLAALRKKAAELEQRVKELENLLEKCNRAREEAIGAALGWQSKKNWRKLKVGMRESQVKSILGEPSKIIQGSVTLWYYPNIYGGYVSFDKQGKLAGWNEP
ncbi:MAG: outer membrane protein assembly factor BamE [Deltaproteobacteria bacterium]|nr:outer membrane protein assembly factor BamE [Deltaproteobacteria bacterium]